MNIGQNNAIRYMAGLSRYCHISNTRKILKILSIGDLFKYMKLIFVKNLSNNKLCQNIFNTLLITNHKNNSISFIKSFKDICSSLGLDENYVIKNIKNVIKDLKETCLLVDDNTETELITLCLRNNQDCEMINQHNLITYAEPQ
jgi:hypothetical protein